MNNPYKDRVKHIDYEKLVQRINANSSPQTDPHHFPLSEQEFTEEHFLAQESKFTESQQEIALSIQEVLSNYGNVE